MSIGRITWTDHAELRLGERGLTRFEVEEAVRDSDDGREANRGDADWRIEGVRADGRKFVVVYDCPIKGDESVACVVSAWPSRRARRSRQGPKRELS